MKKIIAAALLAISLNVNAQTESKEVTLSLKHFELYSILKQSNSFSEFPKIPEKVTEVYECGKLQYILAETDYYTLHIMPDDEFRFFIKELNNRLGNTSVTYYIRFPQNQIFGYRLAEYGDETRVMVYQKNKFVHKDEIKKT